MGSVAMICIYSIVATDTMVKFDTNVDVDTKYERTFSVKVCSHVMVAFVLPSTVASRFNITQIENVKKSILDCSVLSMVGAEA